MRREIAILAGPRGWDDTRESWLAKVCKAVPTVSYRTVKAFWYAEIEDPDNHWAAREIRRAVAAIEAQRHAASVAGELEAILSGRDGPNPALDGKSTAALVHFLRAFRGQDSAGDGAVHMHKADPPVK